MLFSCIRAMQWIFIIVRFVYVLGVLIHTIHSPNNKPFKLFGTSVEQYKAFAMDLKFGKFPNLSCIPAGIVDNVRLMIHYDPNTRPNLYELPKVSSVWESPLCRRMMANNFNWIFLLDSIFRRFWRENIELPGIVIPVGQFTKIKVFQGIAANSWKVPRTNKSKTDSSVFDKRVRECFDDSICFTEYTFDCQKLSITKWIFGWYSALPFTSHENWAANSHFIDIYAEYGTFNQIEYSSSD